MIEAAGVVAWIVLVLAGVALATVAIGLWCLRRLDDLPAVDDEPFRPEDAERAAAEDRELNALGCRPPEEDEPPAFTRADRGVAAGLLALGVIVLLAVLAGGRW